MDVKLSLSFLLWLLGYVVGLCTFVFIRMDIMYLTLIYGFGVTKHVLLSAEMKRCFKFSSITYICLVVIFLFYIHLKYSTEVKAFP